MAGAQATNKIVPMPQTVCRGISAQAFMPYFATRLCDVQPYFYSAAALVLASKYQLYERVVADKLQFQEKSK